MKISFTSTLISIALLGPGMALAQTTPAQPAPAQVAAAPQPQLLDRVVAIVNGDVLLESDVEEEQRYAAFEPFSAESKGNPRAEAMDRLIDRTLIEQQMHTQPTLPQISDADLDKELTQIRKNIPACARYACYTENGWENYCKLQGFTTQDVAERWRARMQLLAFIEQRYRTGIRISQAEIESYYNTSFVPRFKERNLPAPPLGKVSDRIQEILLQQRVNVMLSDWLKGLRQQGTVQILDPTLVSPTPGEAGS